MQHCVSGRTGIEETQRERQQAGVSAGGGRMRASFEREAPPWGSNCRRSAKASPSLPLRFLRCRSHGAGTSPGNSGDREGGGQKHAAKIRRPMLRLLYVAPGHPGGQLHGWSGGSADPSAATNTPPLAGGEAAEKAGQ